jgi:hypothetical protein
MKPKTIQQFINSTIRCLFILSFIFYLLSFIYSVPVSSQEQKQSALGISPAILELVLDPGKSTETKVTVTNVTNFPLPIKGSAQNFTVNEEISEEEKEIYDCSSWIKIEPSDFILQPRENKEITISINVPNKAEPGGHYATIYFQPLLPAEVLSPQTAYLTARVGILSFNIVRGNLKEKGSLIKTSVVNIKKLFDKIYFSQYGPIEFELEFNNEGNVHISPTGEVYIKNLRNKVIKKIPISPTTVLPKTFRKIKVVWEDKYLIGKFSASATVLYGIDHNISNGKSVDFWVIPWVAILATICFLTTIIYFFTIKRKRLVLAFKVLFGKAEAKELKKIKPKNSINRVNKK